jgi:hypothetical protein
MATYYVKSTNATEWVASTAYALGARVVPTRAYGVSAAKKYVFEATTGGTSGTPTQPTWPTTPGGTVSDGTVTWTCREATSWANASRYLDYIMGTSQRAAAGDTIYLSHNHAETFNDSGAGTLTSPGTAASWCRVICANDGAEPPTALATSASITHSANVDFQFAGHCYYYGVEFVMASGGSSGNTFGLNSSANWGLKFEACKLTFGTSGASAVMAIGRGGGTEIAQYLLFENTKIQFNNVGQTIQVNANFTWKNTLSALAGSTFPTSLFTPTTSVKGTGIIDGVDLSAMGSGKNLVNIASNVQTKFYFMNCKLGSSVGITTGTIGNTGGVEVYLHNCDSANTNYRMQETRYTGTVTQETTIVRSSGASDGTTPLSWKMVSGSGAWYATPLPSPPIALWNDTTGSSKSVTIEIVHDNATALKDDEIWLEVGYPGDSSTPQRYFASDRKSDILATAADQTSSSVTWTTTGLSSPNKQKLVATFTPQKKGTFTAVVMLAKASYTVYVDPLATVT